MNTKSILNLYQYILIEKKEVSQATMSSFEKALKEFIIKKIISRNVNPNGRDFNELVDICWGEVIVSLVKLSKRGMTSLEVIHYICAVIENTLSRQFKKNYDFLGNYITLISIDMPLRNQKGEIYSIVDTLSDGKNIEKEILQKMSQRALIHSIQNQYGKKREFSWLLKEINGKSNCQIAREEKISNSYIGRQKKSLKEQIKLIYLQEYQEYRSW